MRAIFLILHYRLMNPRFLLQNDKGDGELLTISSSYLRLFRYWTRDKRGKLKRERFAN